MEAAFLNGSCISATASLESGVIVCFLLLDVLI